MDGQRQLAVDRSIRFKLTLPITRIGVGPFSFDPVEKLIGSPIADLLEPLRVAPIERKPSPSGTGVEIHSLALPDGEGLAIPLAQFGEIGFRNDEGLLALTVPAAWGPRLQSQLGRSLARGPERGRALDGNSEVMTCWLRLQRGMQSRTALGPLGELAIEAL